MRNPLRLIRVRLTLWHVLSLAVLLAVFSAGVYLALRYQLEQNLDAAIQSRSDVLLQVVDVQDGRPSLPGQFRPPAGEDGDDDDGRDEEFIRLFDRDGSLLLDTSDPEEEIPSLAGQISPVLAGDRRWLDVRGDDDTFRVLVVPVMQGGDLAGALAVGQSTEDVEEPLGTLARIIAIAFPLSVLGAAALGLFVAHRALAPIDRISSSVRQMSAEDFSQRLDLDLPDDELGRLARTFDDLLARLDTAFRRQRQFTADASHELRTPLTIMKGEIEVALSRQREASEYRDVLEATAEQVDRLIGLVNSLLLLARADAGQIPLQREPVDISVAVETAIDQLRPLVEECGVSLVMSGNPVTIPADLSLLLQLLFNLLQNAIRHTPAGGQIVVAWSVNGDRLRLDVSDTGSGIAPEHLPHIFDRFYRVDAARHSTDGGAGIGLSISRWIVESHGGTLSVQSELNQGTVFSATLPASRNLISD